MISVLPVLITSAVEETYPLPAEASTSLLYTAQIVFQVPLTPIAEAIINAEGDSCSTAFSPFHIFTYCIALGMCEVPALLYNGKYRRLEADLASRSENISLGQG